MSDQQYGDLIEDNGFHLEPDFEDTTEEDKVTEKQEEPEFDLF
jgi:hypothetical protein